MTRQTIVIDPVRHRKPEPFEPGDLVVASMKGSIGRNTRRTHGFRKGHILQHSPKKDLYRVHLIGDDPSITRWFNRRDLEKVGNTS